MFLMVIFATNRLSKSLFFEKIFFLYLSANIMLNIFDTNLAAVFVLRAFPFNPDVLSTFVNKE